MKKQRGNSYHLGRKSLDRPKEKRRRTPRLWKVTRPYCRPSNFNVFAHSELQARRFVENTYGFSDRTIIRELRRTPGIIASESTYILGKTDNPQFKYK